MDAAVAMASALTVVEPTCNGLGSDLFALVWHEGKLYGYNGSGKSPASLTSEALREGGFSEMPMEGVFPITVPGAVKGWTDLWERFGSLDFARCLLPAVELGEKGFLVQPQLALLWEDSYRRFGNRKGKEFQEWRKVFAPKGRGPKEGEEFRNPDIARTLQEIGETRGKSFYQGDLGKKIDAHMKEVGGFLSMEDLKAHQGLWVEPLSTSYRGYEVWEIPPNGHGISVLMTLKILEGMDFTGMEESEVRHIIIEAMKLAYADVKEHVADPRFMTVSTEELLDDAYASCRRKGITSRAQKVETGISPAPSTVYFAVADEEMMISMIQSNYEGFGSGIVVPGTSIALNDRGGNFTLRPGHPNEVGGGKRTYHTIIPGFITKEGKPYGAFGVMGGFMQPQGQVQVLHQLLDLGRNPQAALDAPRWMWEGDLTLKVETSMGQGALSDLKARGHHVIPVVDERDMGRGQIILKVEDGYVAGTEKRTDGSIGIL